MTIARYISMPGVKCGYNDIVVEVLSVQMQSSAVWRYTIGINMGES